MKQTSSSGSGSHQSAQYLSGRTRRSIRSPLVWSRRTVTRAKRLNFFATASNALSTAFIPTPTSHMFGLARASSTPLAINCRVLAPIKRMELVDDIVTLLTHDHGYSVSSKQQRHNGGAGEGHAELVRQVLTGENYHAALTSLA